MEYHQSDKNDRCSIFDVLRISLPLILSSSCHAINMLTDRIMLSHYSQEAVAASMTGGLTNFTISCIFFGTVMYTGTFVAQYTGARAYRQIGPIIWQGIFLSLLGGLFMLCTNLFADQMFGCFGHDPMIARDEAVYYKVLSAGAFSNMLNGALSCFWSGRGKTAFVLWISLFMTILNIPLNAAFIFGLPALGISAMGIKGAALGTILASMVGSAIYALAFFSPSARKRFGTTKDILQKKLFLRLVQRGIPHGLQLIIELAAFNVFAVLSGRYGAATQEATSISFGINHVAFCPIMGIGTSVSILVGQAIGSDTIPRAKNAVRNALFLSFFYSGLMILLFTLFPNLILSPFIRPDDPAQTVALEQCRTMLKFISVYLVFDGIGIILGNAIRGAGDTLVCMFIILICGWFVFAVPVLIMHVAGATLWHIWCHFVLYYIIQTAVLYHRYHSGKWTHMKVIEDRFSAGA